MDNDSKIMNDVEEQRHKDVLLFLQKELEPLKLRNRVNAYNLEEEFAKTKKNRSLFIPAILSGCVLIILVVSFVISKSIDKTNRDIKVNVEEFDDINLKNLINTVSRTQEQFESAVKNKAQIESQKKSALNAALDKRDADLWTIDSLNLRSRSEKTKRQSAVHKAYDDEVREIIAQYDPLLDAADAEIETYQNKLNEYDNAKLDAAKEQQKAIDSERQLQELERQKLIKEYELRLTSLENEMTKMRNSYQYELRKNLTAVSEKLQKEIDQLDPVIEDEYAESLLSSPALNNKRILNPEKNHAFGEGNISDLELKKLMAEIKQMYLDYKYLDQKVLDIPHRNQIGLYTEADSYLVDLITESLAEEVYGQYKDKVSVMHELDQEKRDHEADVKRLEKEKEAIEAARKQEKYDLLYEGMLGLGISSIIADTPVSKDEIYIYIRPDARFLLGENGEAGCEAEIPFKKPIKGRVEKTADGRFRFVPEMKNGKYVDFDLEALKMGVQVKLK